MQTQNSFLTISQTGVAMVEHFEDLFLKAYWDATGDCWTIGYGHTGLQHKDGTVYRGRVITKAQADELLAYDMHQYEGRVKALVQTRLTQYQFDALVSFDFNCDGLTIGPQNATPSTILNDLNKSDWAGAADQFPLWKRSGGQVLSGLVRRRAAEREMFIGGDWTKFKK